MAKWRVFHSTHNPSVLPPTSVTVQSFNEGIYTHLKKPLDINGERNQPLFIIDNTINKQDLGTLSRIFDSFAYSVDSNNIIQLSQKPNGLRKHIKELVEEVSLTLLNSDRTKLNENIIQAINEININDTSFVPPQGESLTTYEWLIVRTNSSEEDIALQFMKSAVVSYAQRALDNVTQKSPELKEQYLETKNNIYNLGKSIQVLADEIVLKTGINEHPKHCLWQPAVLTQKALEKIIQEYRELINEAYDIGIISDINNLKDKIDGAEAWVDMEELPLETKQSSVSKLCKEASIILVEAAHEKIKEEVNPPQVSWVKSLIRTVTRNEQLFETSGEKTSKIYAKIHALEAQLRESQIHDAAVKKEEPVQNTKFSAQGS